MSRRVIMKSTFIVNHFLSWQGKNPTLFKNESIRYLCRTDVILVCRKKLWFFPLSKCKYLSDDCLVKEYKAWHQRLKYISVFERRNWLQIIQRFTKISKQSYQKNWSYKQRVISWKRFLCVQVNEDKIFVKYCAW